MVSLTVHQCTFFYTYIFSQPLRKWRFPKIGVPPNQPFIDWSFHEINHPAVGVPPWLRKPPKWWMFQVNHPNMTSIASARNLWRQRRTSGSFGETPFPSRAVWGTYLENIGEEWWRYWLCNLCGSQARHGWRLCFSYFIKFCFLGESAGSLCLLDYPDLLWFVRWFCFLRNIGCCQLAYQVLRSLDHFCTLPAARNVGVPRQSLWEQRRRTFFCLKCAWVFAFLMHQG